VEVRVSRGYPSLPTDSPRGSQMQIQWISQLGSGETLPASTASRK
jgi:hypothetical protein